MTTTEAPRWYTSSHSSNGGACVEVAANLATPHGVIPIRDSKTTDGAQLAVGVATFAAFVSGVRNGAV